MSIEYINRYETAGLENVFRLAKILRHILNQFIQMTYSIDIQPLAELATAQVSITS